MNFMSDTEFELIKLLLKLIMNSWWHVLTWLESMMKDVDGWSKRLGCGWRNKNRRRSVIPFSINNGI